MKSPFLALAPVLFCACPLCAQHDHDSLPAAGRHHTHHHDHRNEIAVAWSPVLAISDGTASHGLHIHYMYTLSKTPFALGVGYEKIFDEHGHNSINFPVTYALLPGWTAGIACGIAFEDGSAEKHFSLHLETTYEFELGPIHIGPLLEYGHDREEDHLSLGLHLGLGF